MTSAAGGMNSPDRAGGMRRPQHLVPCTIRQILNQSNSDDVFRIDGRDTYYVKIVGLILRVARAQLSSVYTLDDGTGTMDVRIYVEGGDAGQPGAGAAQWIREQQEQWVEHTYVSVIGYMKAMGDKRSLQASRIKLITDHNEITHHLLEVAHAHLMATKNGGANADGYTTMGYMSNYTTTHQDMMDTSTTYTAGGAGLAPINDLVLDVLRRSSEQGLHVDEIASAVGRSADEIRDVMTNMLSEGFVYNTMSEDHYKNT